MHRAFERPVASSLVLNYPLDGVAFVNLTVVELVCFGFFFAIMLVS
jgi:hypothetical protein